MVDALRRRSIPHQIAWDVGLLVGTARAPQERFAGRIVVPEVRGDAVVWMTGRLVESEAAPLLAGPKYMSLPVARVLGGASALVGHLDIVLVEGPVDWLALVQWGLPDCYVGSDGVPEDAEQLLASARSVYVAFDQDAAGQHMAHTLARKLTGRVRFVRLPAGIKDVAELGQYADGLDRFRRCIRAALRHMPIPITS